MKHNRLHSVAHNFTDSLSSGLGFVVGYCPTRVYSDAARSGDTGVVIDFLTGKIFAEHVSDELKQALPRFQNAFPLFCCKHNVECSDFHLFRARFTTGRRGDRYIVTIEDSNGKCSSIEYKGTPGRRIKQLDDRGRLRPNVLAKPDPLSLAG